MCGLTGYLTRHLPAAPEVVLAAMGGTLRHRGPDGDGTWSDAEAGVGLGHTRLSVIDLTDAGAQPMVSSCGRMVIVYNGEVYNADELRRELAGAGRSRFRGHSDTEVVVEACALWGVAETVRRLVGMFAIALWDRETKTLSLVRDRLGIKPLYWGRSGDAIMFGSELKAIRAYPGFSPTLDRGALAAYMRLGHVPAPYSIYTGVSKLTPGTILTVTRGGEPRIERFWDLETLASEGQRHPRALSDEEAVDDGEALLRDAVKRRMVSDVPLGALLSGGIDSSTVVALMQAQSGRPIQTYAIGFAEAPYDEAPAAAAVAKHLGTDHTELYVDAAQARRLIPGLPDTYDEPFADSSQIPTTLVSAMTRKHVTVALSGDGGDEIFAGYNRYILGDAARRRMAGLPMFLRAALARGLSQMSLPALHRLLSLVPSERLPAHPGQKLHKLADILQADGEMDIYRRLVAVWPDPAAIVPGAVPPPHPIWDDGAAGDMPGFIERMQVIDSLTVLPDDMLTKIDRASMAAGLEVRVPLLDHRVVEFAWSLPRRMRVRDGEGKWLLRRVLDRYVPQPLTRRAKMGFSLPLGDWLRGPLRDWAEDLLDPAALAQDGMLNPAPIREAWRVHLTGDRNLSSQIWTVLMFQAWRRRWT
ncbi:MAG: asparagine synthase (glutamine-hydrolyzing) [Rhodospirillaceae bacterium]|mgnify:CR=1 FL=1|nr:asparagine synthase (glutamine-hydrolyzing) [Rhodospirillaceae bacterium]